MVKVYTTHAKLFVHLMHSYLEINNFTHTNYFINKYESAQILKNILIIIYAM